MSPENWIHREAIGWCDIRIAEADRAHDRRVLLLAEAVAKRIRDERWARERKE
jgi:hypothetical protein